MNSEKRLLHGVDIVEIERVKRLTIKWGDHFLRRFFTPAELEYSFSYRDPYPHLAVRFAAKEAASKALSSVMTCYISNFEVVGKRGEPPFIRLLKPPFYKGNLSTSHTHKLALASVIFEWRQDEDISV